jgi:hypothetical protein
MIDHLEPSELAAVASVFQKIRDGLRTSDDS